MKRLCINMRHTKRSPYGSSGMPLCILNYNEKNKTRNIFVTFLVFVVIMGCKIKEKPIEPAPLYPVPSQKQLNWQKDETLMFAHFGMKTFYSSDWHMGDGTEDPNKFNPVDFDPVQWAKAAKVGGFKGIVLTSKHPDGFCNWQTRTTDHSLKSASWRNGKGDVVSEFVEACHKEGLLAGLYISILDLNYQLSGNDPKNYSSFLEAQISELLTNYGEIDELWIDGYHAERMEVDYKKIAALIAKLQPDMIVYDSGLLVDYMPAGSCVSWPGAHGGLKDPNWSFTNEKGPWYPAEASIIAQGNWFYDNNPIISLDKLIDYYRSSVGMNAVALINVAPNREGLIDDASVIRLKEFKAWVDGLNKKDLTQSEKVKITADSWRGSVKAFAPENAIDGKYDTYFATDDGVKTATIEIDMGAKIDIEGIMLQEYIPLGQRVSSFSIECFDGTKWIHMASLGTIGYKRLVLSESPELNGLKFPRSEKVRLTIIDSRACPLINTIKIIGRP